MKLLLLSQILIILIASCGTLQVGIYRTPTPDTAPIATLAAMMYEGTRMAAKATEMNIPSTPTPSNGIVSGKICYTSNRVPSMTAYFRNINTEKVTTLNIENNQSEYRIELPPGKYYAYAWVGDYQIGVLYSQAVACGLSEACTNHSPLALEVKTGSETSSVDLCDWGIPISQLPVPPGTTLK
ncbi:MAG: hypothetical protein ACM3PY_13620 [Omnitrophica WOR_2 bacterium]